MLAELSIKNVAIIDELTIPFEKGLTVLTGETGAGKSIIIDAVGLLIGGRGSSEFVRHGSQKAEIEGLFVIEKEHPAVTKASELGIVTEEDDSLILRREISTNGKSVCRINGKLVTLGNLREIGQTLVDIHGQHEHQVLLQRENHLSFLDHFAERKVKKVLSEYKELYNKFTTLQKEIEQMAKNEQEVAQRLDLIQYQIKEINDAKLLPNEDEQLLLERHKLANSEKLYKALQDSYSSLYGEGKGLDWLRKALANLEEAKEIDEQLAPLLESVSNCYYLLEDTSFSLRNELEQVEFNPDRLTAIEARLDEIRHLKRKYGSTVEEIMEYGKKIVAERHALENKEELLTKAEQQLKKTTLKLAEVGKQLSNIRKEEARALTSHIHDQLKSLYMDKTIFHIKFKKVEANECQWNEENIGFTSKGIDEVEFQLSTNPGEPLKSLAKIASGGEISRIMLALKTVFSSDQGVTSLIFDEVDTGVSGRVAQAIGERIHSISINSQVLCITHLPQVAAMADHHLFIAKEQRKDRTKTHVTPLSKEDRVREIARMIAGVEVTEITLEHAKELYEVAEKIKSNS